MADTPDSPDYWKDLPDFDLDFSSFTEPQQLLHSQEQPDAAQGTQIDRSSILYHSWFVVFSYPAITTRESTFHHFHMPMAAQEPLLYTVPTAQRGRPPSGNTLQDRGSSQGQGRPQDPTKHHPYSGPHLICGQRAWEGRADSNQAPTILLTSKSGPPRQRKISEFGPAPPPLAPAASVLSDPPDSQPQEILTSDSAAPVDKYHCTCSAFMWFWTTS
ncbi:hypothetical protein GGX14DRAFT_390825 [Mycena pura]|uniref:Uncharacterized protein n=1 Tax=Mycena pura TaxID=153505 RepID=A0AAD6YJU4_9AGAR|nr:hypothetical protein GGX14DRAFT_390825 [Mycena pura]